MGLTPVHFFSHGSTMMLGEESESADYWKKCGDEALARNIKGVVVIGAHWDCMGGRIELATNPDPDKSPVAYIHPDKYANYKLNPDLDTTTRCIDMLAREGFNVGGNDTFDWIHVYLILIRMFPSGCPPDVDLGECPLRSSFPYENRRYSTRVTKGELFVHQDGRWAPMLRFRDNFALESPPEDSAMEFRQAVEDVITKTSGPQLRRAMTRLMKHPRFRDAHALFVAGAAEMQKMRMRRP